MEALRFSGNTNHNTSLRGVLGCISILLVIYWSLSMGVFDMLMVTGLIFWLPLFPWALYTYVENRSIRELERRLRINLRSARILALIGIVALVIVACFGWILHLSALNFPFVSGIFASPFLVASCVLLIKRLKLLSDVPKKNLEPVSRP